MLYEPPCFLFTEHCSMDEDTLSLGCGPGWMDSFPHWPGGYGQVIASSHISPLGSQQRRALMHSPGAVTHSVPGACCDTGRLHWPCLQTDPSGCCLPFPPSLLLQKGAACPGKLPFSPCPAPPSPGQPAQCPHAPGTVLSLSCWGRCRLRIARPRQVLCCPDTARAGTVLHGLETRNGGECSAGTSLGSGVVLEHG